MNFALVLITVTMIVGGGSTSTQTTESTTYSTMQTCTVAGEQLVAENNTPKNENKGQTTYFHCVQQ